MSSSKRTTTSSRAGSGPAATGSPDASTTTAVSSSHTYNTMDRAQSHSGNELDELWDSIRNKKEKKLSREKPKVQSIERMVTGTPLPQSVEDYEENGQQRNRGDEMMMQEVSVIGDAPVMEPPRPKRRKSISSIRESSDGKSLVSIFDLSGVCKEDIHVGFQRQRLVLTWATAELTTWEEDVPVEGEEGEYRRCLMRERSEKIYSRTIPLAEGTRFADIHGAMNGNHLILRYPNMRCVPLKRN